MDAPKGQGVLSHGYSLQAVVGPAGAGAGRLQPVTFIMPRFQQFLESALLCIGTPVCATEFSCSLPIEIQKSDVTLFGEIHGTNESPALVAEYLCAMSSSGRRAVLVLELPIAEQHSIDRYLSSPGKRKDREQFINSEFWRSDFQDGRASVAMFDLIDRVRELRTQGASISIVADDGFQQQDRNRAVAERILQIRDQDSGAAIVALFGNYHTGKAVGTPFDPHGERVGYRIRHLHPLTINIDFHTGWAWACTPKCGVNRFGNASSSQDPVRLELLLNDAQGHDAAVVLPKVTASPPAKAMRIDG